jgi:hypothetical protein
MPTDDRDDDLPYPDFETRDDVRSRSNHRVMNFKKSRNHDLKNLARKLDACITDRPCGSGACPRCLRAHRLHWIADVCRLVETQWSGQ